jgi:hypothetical protein
MDKDYLKRTNKITYYKLSLHAPSNKSSDLQCKCIFLKYFQIKRLIDETILTFLAISMIRH